MVWYAPQCLGSGGGANLLIHEFPVRRYAPPILMGCVTPSGNFDVWYGMRPDASAVGAIPICCYPTSRLGGAPSASAGRVTPCGNVDVR